MQTELPDRLPDHWVFPPPPVCPRYWSERAWVEWAAPYNICTTSEVSDADIRGVPRDNASV